MPIHEIDYLHWAKTHVPAAYELTVSGVARVTTEELGMDAGDWSLLVRGAYGRQELIELIAARYGVSENQVLPVTGTSMANFVALASACVRGDIVAIERPAYEPLIRAAEFLGLTVERFNRTAAARFAPDLDHVRAVLDRGARAVVMSDLHNPSGCLCPEAEMRQLVELCAAGGATLMVDEVYRDFAHLNCGLAVGTAASVGPHVISTNSLTKVYGFGGLRAGWVIASPQRIELARHVFNHLCVDLPAPTTSAAIRILRDIHRFAERTCAIWRHHFEIFSPWADSRQDLRHYGNDGGLYAYLQLPEGLGADAFCDTLRRSYDTQVVSGAYFGDSDHIRIGFGDPSVDLAEGLRRVGAALDQLK